MATVADFGKRVEPTKPVMKISIDVAENGWIVEVRRKKTKPSTEVFTGNEFGNLLTRIGVLIGPKLETNFVNGPACPENEDGPHEWLTTETGGNMCKHCLSEEM